MKGSHNLVAMEEHKCESGEKKMSYGGEYTCNVWHFADSKTYAVTSKKAPRCWMIEGSPREPEESVLEA